MSFSFSKHRAIGIDISDTAIEVVVAEKSGSKISLVNKFQSSLAPGIVSKGEIQDKKSLADALSLLFSQNNIKIADEKSIVFGLPESQSYIHVFGAKFFKNQDEYDQIVRRELERSIPITYDNLVISRDIVLDGKENVNIITAMAEHSVFAGWTDFFHSLGARNVLIMPETLAASLGLSVPDTDKPFCVLNIGAVTASLAVYGQTGIVATFLIKAGEVANEIKTSLSYIEKQKAIKVKKIILVGNSSLSQISEMLSKEIGLPVEIGKVAVIPENNSAEYVEAFGLALAGLDENKSKNLFFSELYLKKQKISVPTILPDSESEKTEPNDSDGAGADVDEEKKLKKQKIILGVIVVVGLIAVALAFWYQANQQKQQQAELASQQTNFSVVQKFDFDIPVAVDAKEKTADRINGRLFTDTFTMRALKDEAIAFSKINASRDLKTGEKLWNEPVKIAVPARALASTTPATELKYSLTWLIYNDSEANTFAQNKVSSALTGQSIKFAINNIEKTIIKPSDNPNIYLLTVSVSIALEKNLDNVIIK